MDAKVDNSSLQFIDEKDLAIGIQIAAAIGPNRQITLTSGVPLEWAKTAKLSETVDSLLKVIDRRNAFSMLDVAKAELERAKREVHTNLEQRNNMEVQFALEWDVRGRKGAVQYTESQKKQLANFEQSAKHLREVVLPKLEAQLAELEAQTKAG